GGCLNAVIVHQQDVGNHWKGGFLGKDLGCLTKAKKLTEKIPLERSQETLFTCAYGKRQGHAGE
ncbi:MAG: hypothetical protein WBD93_02800, partial [Acidobacteriaceae bacterium]